MGAQGGVIRQHRAFRRHESGASERLRLAALAAGLTGVWLALLPVTMRWWAGVLSMWAAPLGLRAPEPGELRLFGWLVRVPLFPAHGAAPGDTLLLVTTLVAFVCLAVTYLRRMSIPVAYLLRALALVQLASGAWFASVASGDTALAASVHLTAFAGVALVTLVPAVHGLTFYLVDLPATRKAGLTLLTMAHLAVLIPLQYTAHVYVVHRASLLFLPVLAVFGGMLVQVLVFVAWYGWGMSWRHAGSGA